MTDHETTCPRCSGRAKILTPEGLKSLRKSSGQRVTQIELAGDLGMGNGYLSDMENGHREIRQDVEEYYRERFGDPPDEEREGLAARIEQETERLRSLSDRFGKFLSEFRRRMES